QDALAAAQLFDHVVDGDGERGEFVAIAAARQDRAIVAAGDAAQVLHVAADRIHNAADQHVTHDHHVEQQKDQEVELHMAGERDHLLQFFPFLLDQVGGEGDDVAAVFADVNLGVANLVQPGGIVAPDGRKAGEAIFVGLEAGADLVVTRWADDSSETIRVLAQDAPGRVRLFERVVEVGAVQKEVLFEAAGLVDFEQKLAGDFVEMDLAVDPRSGGGSQKADGQDNGEKEEDTEINLQADAEDGPFLERFLGGDGRLDAAEARGIGGGGSFGRMVQNLAANFGANFGPNLALNVGLRLTHGKLPRGPFPPLDAEGCPTRRRRVLRPSADRRGKRAWQ